MIESSQIARNLQNVPIVQLKKCARVDFACWMQMKWPSTASNFYNVNILVSFTHHGAPLHEEYSLDVDSFAGAKSPSPTRVQFRNTLVNCSPTLSTFLSLKAFHMHFLICALKPYVPNSPQSNSRSRKGSRTEPGGVHDTAHLPPDHEHLFTMRMVAKKNRAVEHLL